MKLTSLLLTTSLCAVAGAPAFAQGQPFGDVDANGDGVLSFSELEAVFGTDQATRIMARADSNGDNVLSLNEVRGSDDDESDDDESDDDESDDNESDDDESDDDESGGDDSSDESDDSESDS